jgi:hypothetical protein
MNVKKFQLLQQTFVFVLTFSGKFCRVGSTYLLGSCFSLQTTQGESSFGENCKNFTFKTGYPVSFKPLVKQKFIVTR